MSHSAPVSVSEEFVSKFKSATEGSGQKGQLFKAQIRDEVIVVTHSTNGTGNLSSDFAEIQSVADDDEASYFVIRVGEPRHWLLLSYVPDGVSVKEKMIIASAKGTLKDKLGYNCFEDEVHATSKEELSWEAYQTARTQVDSRTASEIEHEEVLRQEEEAREDMSKLQMEDKPTNSSVSLPLDSSARNALSQLRNGRGGVSLALNSDRTSVTGSSLPSSPSEWPAQIHPSEPRFYVLRSGESPAVFVYSCPSSAPPKQRMTYSTAKASVRQQVEAEGVRLSPRSLEISEKSELEEGLKDTRSAPVNPRASSSFRGKIAPMTGRLGMDASNAPELGGQVKARHIPTISSEHPIYSLMNQNSGGAPKKKIVMPPRAAYYG